jgi:hypothetical protein
MLAGGVIDPYNVTISTGRDLALFSSKDDVAFITRTLKESVHNL